VAGDPQQIVVGGGRGEVEVGWGCGSCGGLPPSGMVNRPSWRCCAGSRQVGGPIALLAVTGSGVNPQVGGRRLPDSLPQGLQIGPRTR
jgi:hypothetical protein